MKKMSSNEIRNSWIKYFEKLEHIFLPAKSLVPENDPSLLWINSGVATLKDYFSGKKNPPSPRLVNSQKAIRTNDFFNVGVTSRHHTFFEMLGNFSIGDYFKLEAIKFAFDLLTKEWEINSDLLWITVFEDDIDSYNKWIELGIRKEQIIKCNADRNFWDVGMGPCGPCTEIHYDRGEKYDPNKLGPKLILEDIENDRYVEIWNIVFSQFNNDGNNNYTELARKNIDTGAGLERLASISQDVPTNFDTDLFLPIINSIEKYSEYKYNINAYFTKDEFQTKINFAYRVIADHLRASVFSIADGVIPSNKERGYILRRLLRRLLVYIHNLKINNNDWLIDAVNSIIKIMGDFYKNLEIEKERIINAIQKEISLFEITLKQGMKILESSISNKILDSNTTFKLVTTYGFPIELINEFAKEKNIIVDINGFEKLYEEHQKISNANKNIVGMDKQNSALLNLDIESKFEYNSTELDSKIIKLFNNEFNEVNELSNEDGYVIVDVTPFYATSGGQIHDTGYINEFYVDDVFKTPNFQHVHHIKSASLKINENVHLAINIENRRKNMAHHSSEHILQAALKNIIDENIKQKGAFKSPEKLTFDFQLDYKLSNNQLAEIENWVNNYIQEKHNVDVLFMNLEEAKKNNVIGYFEDVYKKITGPLRVIKIGNKSIELCGGTHVNNTIDIESFKIINLLSKGSGMWRIEAISTIDNINKYYEDQINNLNKTINNYKIEFEKNNYDLSKLNIVAKKYENKFKNSSFYLFPQIFIDFNNEINLLKNELATQNNLNIVIDIKSKFNQQNSKIKYIDIENVNDKSIMIALEELSNEHQDTIFFITTISNDKLQYFIATNKNNNINLNNFAKDINQIIDGKGGGKPNFVRGGSSYINKKIDLENYIKKIGN